MKQEEIDILKSYIVENIQKQRSELDQLENNTAPISPENSIGRISRMDAINNKSVVEASIRNRKRKLAKLQVALSKLSNKDFGMCSKCKKPIQIKRLMVMPESDQCVNCA